MEVTRKNFKDSLPLIKSSIAKADFLAIDTEFTGLRNGRDVSIFDTPREYYKNLLNGTSEFLLIQFGLCAFFWDEKIEQYRHEAYNFYLFPRGKPGPEKIFMCQSSSLDFLASQGFDFNKLIREGISYMPEAIESKLRETLKERQKSYSNGKDIITIPEENKQQIEEICEKVRCFLNETKQKEMEVDRCNAFIRRLLFQELGSRFKNEAFVETVVLENKNRVLKVTRLDSASESKDRDTQKKEKEWEEFELAVGFSKVARMISESEKLVIGHNMILDLLHTLNHFFQPLPTEYASFKEFAHCMFPMILDTKYMSSLPPFKDKVNSSVLTHLLATLSETPFSLPKVDAEKSLGYTLSDEKQHEAGYDAYITGLCFLSMHAHLSKMRGDATSRVSAPNCAVLKPFLNKLFLARTAHYDSPYMNLAGVDPMPSREHMFYLTFPKEWQRNEINQLFSPFGSVTVQFLDDTSALIALARKEQARDVAKLLAKNKRICLLSYAEYKSKTQSAQDAEEERRSSVSFGKNMTPDGKTRYATKNRISTPNKVISSPHKIAKNMLPGKVDRSAIPEKVDRNCLPEKVDRNSLPEKVERNFLPEKVERTTLPEKVERNTLSEKETGVVTSPPHTTNRKRTSSGVFQVDEAEPPPKKAEVTRSNSDGANKKPEVLSKGRRRNGSETAIDKLPTEKDNVIPVIETFKNDGNSKCVDAFKESDSWD